MKLEEYIINTKGLKRTFKVNQREKADFISTIKSFIFRDYRYIEAILNIDFKVKTGEIRGLIGPNGAGKSTTIKILSGILYPTAGEVKVMGYIPWTDREAYVKNIGVVFGQKSQLWWDLPPIDTFLLNKKMYKVSEKVFKDNLEYFKDLFNISDVITRPTRLLSLGERMKCELICAMLHEPKLVFLDEPTIGLDILSKEAIRNFIKQTNKEKNTTFILTTHDLSDIENLCGNITIINKGVSEYDGTLKNLKNFISNNKIVQIEFTQPVPRKMLDVFKIKSYDPLFVEIEMGQVGIQAELTKIISSFPVHDININDISIEEVIKQMYSA
jgi:ABC-2 type transport system ATP-binding protein